MRVASLVLEAGCRRSSRLQRATIRLGSWKMRLSRLLRKIRSGQGPTGLNCAEPSLPGLAFSSQWRLVTSLGVCPSPPPRMSRTCLCITIEITLGSSRVMDKPSSLSDVLRTLVCFSGNQTLRCLGTRPWASSPLSVRQAALGNRPFRYSGKQPFVSRQAALRPPLLGQAALGKQPSLIQTSSLG